ncbi:MAG: hypothetical protein [Caudovirales sp. ctOwN3]|nr:MAG: hypothetical protein [Caudovirales sp. ctOwN3]
MCKNNKCPSRRDCYRFRANPSEMQYYADFAPEGHAKTCSYFIDAREYPHYALRRKGE